MSQIEKLLEKLLSRPKDLSWDELTKILGHFGYFELRRGKTSGSRRKFINSSKSVISLHKPHPGNIIKGYQVNDIIYHLKEKGDLK